MAKSKTPVDVVPAFEGPDLTKPLWPAWESPKRIEYPDLTEPLSRSFYDQAREFFTAANIKEANEAISQPEGFDIESRLRRAVYLYYWCKAGRTGDIGFIDLLPKSAQMQKLVDLIKNTDALLSICEKRPDYIASLVKEYDDRAGREASWDFMQNLAGALRRLKNGAEAKKAKTKTVKGNKEDIARRVFCGHLLMIYEEATGTTATSTKDAPAHNFFSVCFTGFIDPEIGEVSTLNYLKNTIRDREQIKASALFSKCYDESEKTVPAFSARIVIKPAS